MSDREKVIKGLTEVSEYMRAKADVAGVGKGKEVFDSWYRAAEDAIALIESDTPMYIPTPNSSRLLSFDETLDRIRTGQPYYLENNPDASETWHSMLNYGRAWRCWNTEPEKEQMERTPWNS